MCVGANRNSIHNQTLYVQNYFFYFTRNYLTLKRNLLTFLIFITHLTIPDAMTVSKRCAFAICFILKCLTKCTLIGVLKVVVFNTSEEQNSKYVVQILA